MPSISALSLSLSLILATAGATTHAQPDFSSPVPSVALLKGYLCEASDYPAAALRRGTQGTVRIRFTAEPDGKISDVVVIKSSGETKEHKILDLVSKRQMQSCRLAGKEPTLEPRTHDVELLWKLR